MTATAQLVRCVQDGRERGEVRRLMSERRRLLRTLILQENDPAHAYTLESLEDAVAESDRTLETLLGDPGH